MGISAILPIHNEARILSRVLDSIDRQSRKPDELILVLDACSDASESIARSRSATIVRIEARNMASAVVAGASVASHPTLVLFDGNTLVPPDYVERLAMTAERTDADLVEWHGGMMLLSKRTFERYGPPSRIHLWTLEYFLRVTSAGGSVVRLNGPHERLKRSPIRRNIRYGLDYADLSARYDLAPFFRI